MKPSLTRRIQAHRSNTQTAGTPLTITPLSPAVAHVVMRFPSKPSAKEIANAVSKHFGTLAAPVHRTWREVAGTKFGYQVSGYLASQFMSRPVSETANMIEIGGAGSTFMDKEDKSIWSMTAATGGSVLVRNMSEDLQELVAFASVKAPSEVAATVEAAMTAVPSIWGAHNTQYIQFMNPQTASVDFGARIADDLVVSSNDMQIYEIAQIQVIDTRNLQGSDVCQEIATVDPKATAAQLADYYKRLFRNDPDYFARVESIMSQRNLL